MFVYTVTKKRAIRLLLIVLAVFAGIIIGVAAILTSIKTGATERKVPIYCVERDDNKIALTFDCAWGNSNTDALLAILKKENVRATFFVTGEFCDKYPEDVLKMFKAGHEIQNHSDKHPHIEGININDLIADTREAGRKIRMITDTQPTLYRGPYGEYDNNSIFTVEGMGYKYVQWSVDSVDWQEPDAKTMTKKVVGATKSGAILLFHNDLANTTEALPDIISQLKEKGFDFVPVSDIIYKENYRVDNAGKQIYEGSTDTLNTAIHMSGETVNGALEVLLYNLTQEEIMSLEQGMSPEIAAKLASILSKEQIAAISALSEDELRAAWGALAEAKAAQGNASGVEIVDEYGKDVINGYLNDENKQAEPADAAVTEASTATEAVAAATEEEIEVDNMKS